MLGADPTQTIAENYRRFARLEARGKSPLYEELCEAIADDPLLLRPERIVTPELPENGIKLSANIFVRQLPILPSTRFVRCVLV